MSRQRDILVSESNMSDHRLDQLEGVLGSLQQAMKASEERLMKHMENMSVILSNRREERSSGGYDGEEGSISRGKGSVSSCGGSSTVPKITKLDFPRYDGMEDPTEWICRAEQFFEFQRIEEDEKLPKAEYHLDGNVQL